MGIYLGERRGSGFGLRLNALELVVHGEKDHHQFQPDARHDHVEDKNHWSENQGEDARDCSAARKGDDNEHERDQGGDCHGDYVKNLDDFRSDKFRKGEVKERFEKTLTGLLDLFGVCIHVLDEDAEVDGCDGWVELKLREFNDRIRKLGEAFFCNANIRCSGTEGLWRVAAGR